MFDQQDLQIHIAEIKHSDLPIVILAVSFCGISSRYVAILRLKPEIYFKKNTRRNHFFKYSYINLLTLSKTQSF